MKHCPHCQQTFPDDAPDLCPYDGTQMVSNFAQQPPQQQQYYPGGQQPYGMLGDPSQWQPLPGAYPSPNQYDSASPADTGKLATAALILGITAVSTLVLGFILSASAGSSYYGPNVGMIKFASILFLLMFITGLTAINLGIVALSMAGQNSARKAKSIIGLCLGTVPFLLLIVIFMASGPRFRF